MKSCRQTPVRAPTCNITPRGPNNQACAFARSSSYCHRNCSQHHRNPQSSHLPKKICKESAERGQSRCASFLRWSPFDAITLTDMHLEGSASSNGGVYCSRMSQGSHFSGHTVTNELCHWVFDFNYRGVPSLQLDYVAIFFHISIKTIVSIVISVRPSYM